MKVIWWGGWPWRWRIRFVRRSRYGPFGEFVFLFVGVTWPVDER